MTHVPSLNNFVDGRWVPAEGGELLSNEAPATGEMFAKIPKSGLADVATAVESAQRALRGAWGATSTIERATLLERVADGLALRASELASLESRDTGKPIALTMSVDIPRAVENFRFFAGAIRHESTGCHSMTGALNYTLRQPVGVAALITPWNLPLYLLSWKVAPALAMGNAVVAKPSELTPMTASVLAEVLHDVGAPQGAFNLLHGLGSEVGQALVEHPAVGAVSFTGGTSTGRRVAAAAAPQFKKLSLELGGKNPTLVFADADFEEAVEGAARAAFLNQGQICLCGSRVLVEEAIASRFETALVDRVRQMKIGDPAVRSTEFGSLISREHRAKVESYIELARAEGGEVLIGGTRPQLPESFQNGAFIEPTVIRGLDIGCRTATEEIFGPVVTLHTFRTDDEAVSMANASVYGLAASVWTQSVKRAHSISARLEAGMVWVNTWLLRDLRVPFGGVKDSGVGREGGRHSLEFFSESRNVCIKF